MKQFAFPLSIKCASTSEAEECVKLLCSIGYESGELDNDYTVITNYCKECDMLSTCPPSSSFKYSNNRHHIDHFNPELIRDIASACTNDTWHKGEPILRTDREDEEIYHIDASIYGGMEIAYRQFRRPTLAEICEHHGYEIKGRDIVKKEPKQNNMSKELTFPRVMMVSSDGNGWERRVVFDKKMDMYIAWFGAETIEESKSVITTSVWKYAKEVEEEPIELTIEEIGKKLGIDPTRIRIKE